MPFMAASASSVVLSTPTVLPDSSFFSAAIQHELKHLLKHFLGQSIADDAERRVIRSVFIQRSAQKLTQRQAIVTSPGNSPLAVDPLEITHQQHAEVNAGRNARLAAFF